MGIRPSIDRLCLSVPRRNESTAILFCYKCSFASQSTIQGISHCLYVVHACLALPRTHVNNESWPNNTSSCPACPSAAYQSSTSSTISPNSWKSQGSRPLKACGTGFSSMTDSRSNMSSKSRTFILSSALLPDILG
jgi:hypothetical protein